MSRWPGDIKPVTLVTALRNVISNEGPAVNIMLARIDEQNFTIQKQQKAITALQFRHLLEHLPRALRDRKVAAAGDGQARATAALEWDRASETERWGQFWREAVRQVYEVYKEHGTPTPTLVGMQDQHEDEMQARQGDKTPKSNPVGTQIHEPSPFARLVENYLATAREKGAEASEKSARDRHGNDASKNEDEAAIDWLANQSIIGQRAKRLYSELSIIIHQFSDGEFTANPLNFSPVEFQILTALAPKESLVPKQPLDLKESKKAEDTGLYWKKEFRRYVWTKQEKADMPKAEPSEKGALGRAKRLWGSLFKQDILGILSH